MRIFADIQAVQDRFAPERGVPRYTAEFANATARLEPDLVDQWLLQRGAPVPPSILELMSSGSVRYFDEIDHRPDIVHNLAPFHRVGSGISEHDILDPHLAGNGSKLVATLYDLIPLIYPDVYFRSPTFRDDYLLACSFLQNADLVLTISDSGARDAVRHLGLDPRKVESVGTGVPGSFEPASDRSRVLAGLVRRLPRLRPGFLLYVGGIEFRKNMDGTLRAYAQLSKETRRAHQLVVVCRLVGDSGRHLRALVARLGIARDVLFTDAVDDAVLSRLYQATDLFLFPSFYEGFGLPVIEALRSGAPVVVGDNSSLADIVPVPEARFDSRDPADIAATIERTLASEEARTRTLREVDHSAHRWETVVENTKAAYGRLHPRRPSRARNRIAFVSPMPPAATGIAIYNERLLEQLAKLIDVDLFAQPEAHEVQIPGVRQFSYGAFSARRLLEEYREVVIAMGNSFYHLNEFEILQRYGGTVMLHDVRVTGLLNNIRALRNDLLSEAVQSDLDQLQQKELPGRFGEYPAFDFADQTQANALMSQTITGAAHRVLLHSAAGLSVAQLEAEPHERERIMQVPLAFTIPHAHRRDDADVITSFGYLSETKQSALLCEAFVLAAERLPSTRFAFVGYLGDPELRRAIDSMISQANLSDRIIVTGWQTEAEYSEWLSRSLLTIQPRLNFNGEASAAVTESIGAGVPTIVSDIGWMGELPDDVVRKISPTITARHLAELIVDLATDPEVLANMSSRGSIYAAQHDFSAVAASLFEIVTSDDRRAS